MSWKNFGDFEGTQLERFPVKNVDDPKTWKRLRNDVSRRRGADVLVRQQLFDSFEEVDLVDVVVDVDEEDTGLVAAEDLWKNNSANCLDEQNWKKNQD